MINQAIVVGVVVQNYNDDYILIDSKRNYKNELGHYDSDVIKIWLVPDRNTLGLVHIGQTIAVKGTLRAYGLGNKIDFVAEKISVIDRGKDA
jgi:hypothetical protein